MYLGPSKVARLSLGGRHVADGFEQAAGVEPIDPFESGELDGLEGSPRPTAMDHLGFEQTVDRLGQGVDAPIAVKQFLRRALKLPRYKDAGRFLGRCSASSIGGSREATCLRWFGAGCIPGLADDTASGPQRRGTGRRSPGDYHRGSDDGGWSFRSMPAPGTRRRVLRMRLPTGSAGDCRLERRASRRWYRAWLALTLGGSRTRSIEPW